MIFTSFPKRKAHEDQKNSQLEEQSNHLLTVRKQIPSLKQQRIHTLDYDNIQENNIPAPTPPEQMYNCYQNIFHRHKLLTTLSIPVIGHPFCIFRNDSIGPTAHVNQFIMDVAIHSTHIQTHIGGTNQYEKNEAIFYGRMS